MQLLRRVLASLRPGKRSAAAPRAVLYTRPGCHLCDEMKAEIARSRAGRRLRLVEVDISTDRALVRRFGRRIPVLELDGRPAFEGRLSAADLERALGVG